MAPSSNVETGWHEPRLDYYDKALLQKTTALRVLRGSCEHNHNDGVFPPRMGTISLALTTAAPGGASGSKSALLVARLVSRQTLTLDYSHTSKRTHRNL